MTSVFRPVNALAVFIVLLDSMYPRTCASDARAARCNLGSGAPDRPAPDWEAAWPNRTNIRAIARYSELSRKTVQKMGECDTAAAEPEKSKKRKLTATIERKSLTASVC